MATSPYFRAVAALILVSAGCSSSSTPSQSSGSAGGSTPAAQAAAPKTAEAQAPATEAIPLPTKPGDDQPLPAVPSPEDAIPAQARTLIDKPFTGDFKEAVKRRLIRAGVVYNRTQYYIDRGQQRGMSNNP